MQIASKIANDYCNDLENVDDIKIKGLSGKILT